MVMKMVSEPQTRHALVEPVLTNTEMRARIVKADQPVAPKHPGSQTRYHEIAPNLYLGGYRNPESLDKLNGVEEEAGHVNGSAFDFALAIQVSGPISENLLLLQDEDLDTFSFPSKLNPDGSPGLDFGIHCFDGAADDLVYLIAALKRIDSFLEKQRRVIVYCEDGGAPGAAVTAAYLMAKYNVTADEAYMYLRARRDIDGPRTEPKGPSLSERITRIREKLGLDQTGIGGMLAQISELQDTHGGPDLSRKAPIPVRIAELEQALELDKPAVEPAAAVKHFDQELAGKKQQLCQLMGLA